MYLSQPPRRRADALGWSARPERRLTVSGSFIPIHLPRWSSNLRPILCQCKLTCTHSQHLFVSSCHPDAGTTDTTTARPIGLGARLGSYHEVDILVTLSQPTSLKAKKCISKSMSLYSLSMSISAGRCTTVTLSCPYQDIKPCVASFFPVDLSKLFSCIPRQKAIAQNPPPRAIRVSALHTT